MTFYPNHFYRKHFKRNVYKIITCGDQTSTFLACIYYGNNGGVIHNNSIHFKHLLRLEPNTTRRNNSEV